MRVTLSDCQSALKMFNWRLFLLSQVIISLCSSVVSLEKSDFFPYGPGTEDQVLPTEDNVSSSEIKLAVPLTLYDTKYPSIWVSSEQLTDRN